MVISPYARRGWVSRKHTSFGSILKTIFLITAIPYLNQYDAAATDLSDLFTPHPDFTPYSALPVDGRIFDPQKALDTYDEEFAWKSTENSPALDSPAFTLEQRRELLGDRNR